MKRNISEKNYIYETAVVAIAKNESEYIREWVAFHKVIGVQKIYLYDNDSSDDMCAQIHDFITQGYVTLNTIHGTRRQYDAYNNALSKYGKDCRYMIFIDCDEFILPVHKGENITEIISNAFAMNKNTGGIVVNWCMYGSSGYESKPDGLLTERFVWRAETVGGRGNKCIKSIVRPECVRRYSHPHFPLYHFGFCGFNLQGKAVSGAFNSIEEYVGLRINHYFTKSKEQWIKRRALGTADGAEYRNIEEFLMHDNNDIYDDSASEYTNEVTKIMSNGCFF